AQLRLPVRLLARHDRAARRGRPVLRHHGRAAPLRALDGLEQEGRRHGHVRDGRVLLLPALEGALMTGFVFARPRRRAPRAAALAAAVVALTASAPAALRAQDI